METQRQPAGGPVAARWVRARSARKEADGGSSSGSEKPPEKRNVVTRAFQGLTHRHPRAAHTRGAANPALQFSLAGVERRLFFRLASLDTDSAPD